MNIPVIIAIRLGSTRLPGKALLPFLNGSNMLDEIIKRIRSSAFIGEICIATTNNVEDNELEKYCEDHDLRCFRGSEQNVAERIYQAAKFLEADLFYEVLGDNPLIDPLFFRLLNELHLNNPNLKYASINTQEYKFNANTEFPVGIRVQLLRTNELLVVLRTENNYFHEHATSYFYDKIDQKEYLLIENNGFKGCGQFNLAVNTLEDFYLIGSVLNESINFRWENSLELYKLLK